MTDLNIINVGVCSPATETALMETETCIYDVYKRPSLVNFAVYRLVRDMCTQTVFTSWDNINLAIGRSALPESRFVPLETVNNLNDGSTVRTELQFEHTRNR